MAEKPISTMTSNVKSESIPSYKSKGFTYNLNKPLKYPINEQSDHFVRFYINLDEESRMITKNEVTVLGNVDQTDQTRLRSKPVDQKIFNLVVGAGVGVKAASLDVSNRVNQAVGSVQGFKGNMLRGAATLASKAALGAAGAAVGYTLASQLKVDKALKRLATTITLYTPPTVMNSQRTQWDNYNDVMFELMQLASDQTLSSIMKNSGGIASSMGRILATAGSELVQSATRSAVNPKKDLLFKSVDRREFIFEYQFAPKSKAESDEVANIIQAFRIFSAPEVVQGTDEFLYTYPAEFDIEYGFLSNGVENQNKYLNKISSCILKTVTVNYAPTGTFQTLENGDPIMINMTLHFEELETLHRDRIAAGY